jgi:hypothetical protein
MDRRKFLKNIVFVAPVATVPGFALAAPAAPRRLRFYHTHTSEKLDVTYYEDGLYLPDAMDAVNHMLRDHRSDEIAQMDPALPGSAARGPSRSSPLIAPRPPTKCYGNEVAAWPGAACTFRPGRLTSG